LELLSEKRNNLGKITGVVFAVVPLFLIVFLLFRGTAISTDTFRLDLMNAMMYYTYGVVVGWLVFLFIRKKGIKDIFRRDIINAILFNGGVYAILATVHWLTYFDERYSLYPFSVINVAMALVFLSSALLIGKEFFSRRAFYRSRLSAQVLDHDFTDAELRIIVMIQEGATNKEIAKELGLKLATIKNAIFKIFINMKVKSRTELTRVLRGGQNDDDPINLDD
jgi:DNA-binding CsgD family transcriptional regulator